MLHIQDAVHSLSGGLDGVLKMCDLNSNLGMFTFFHSPIHLLNCFNFISIETVLGIHQDAIRCVEYSTAVNQVFSGSW